MKKTCTILSRTIMLLIVLFTSKHALSQCGTIMVGPNRDIFPSAEENLPYAVLGNGYTANIQFYPPASSNGVAINSISITSVSNLPTGFSYTTSPSNGVINANTAGCIIIQSSRVNIAPGVYPITINFTVNTVQMGQFPNTINNYKIVVLGPGGTFGSYDNSNVTPPTRVGITKNNQQTNGAAYRRVSVLPENKIGVTWTTSTDEAPFLTRGTGYNQFNGTSWIKPDTNTVKIENQRAGFPDYSFNAATNEEVVLSHIVTSTGFAGGFVLSRKLVNASLWNQSVVLDTVSSVPGLLWARTAIANNFLHVVACYNDANQSQPNGVRMAGVNTPVVYSRFNLTTNIWDIKTITLPGYDSMRYFNGTADSYTIDASGNYVGVLMGELGKDLALWKSSNNGSTWIKTIIDTFAQSPYNEAVTLVDPAINTADAHINLLLSQNGNAHCFWTNVLFDNTVLNDGSSTYYPGISHVLLRYWNDGTPIQNIKTIYESTGSNWQDFNTARYGLSYNIANPSAGLSADGKLYCIFSMPSESTGYRDIFGLYSTNNGLTWSNPKNLTSFFGTGIEQAFPSLAKTVNNKIHFVYSQSAFLGPNGATSWDIMYQSVDTATLSKGLFFNQVSKYFISDTVICPNRKWYYGLNNARLFVNDTLRDEGVSESWIVFNSNATIKILSLDGSVLVQKAIIIDNNRLPNNSVLVSKLGLCQNDTITLTAPNNLTYLWEMNMQAVSNNKELKVTLPGQYKLIVTDSLGCSNSSEPINIFNAPIPKAIATVNNATQCLKGNAFNFSDSSQIDSTNYTVLWSFGLSGNPATTKNVSRSFLNAGVINYKLLVTSVYGCKDSIIGSVTVNPNPVAGVILGDSVALTPGVSYSYAIAQQLNHTYEWIVSNGIILNGQATNSITVQWTAAGVGKLTCVVKNVNQCPDTSVINVGVGSAPAIVSFAPTSAKTGDTVVITGVNLTGTTAVKFGGVAAQSFNVVSSTRISAVVGTGATGDVSIENPAGNAALSGFTFIPTSGFASIGNVTSFSVYPNPATDKLFVSYTGNLINKPTDIKIYNIIGAVVYSSALTGVITEVDLTNLTGKGVYLIAITNANNEVVTMQKFVVQ